jgi:hypothetical protein
VTKTSGWFAALFGVAVAVWRGRVWWKARANRAIKVDAVSAHWIAQQRGRDPLT